MRILDNLGNLIEKRPWLVIGIILMITIGFSIITPFLEIGTSTEDFHPDDKIVKANDKVTNYFGGTDEVMLIYVKKQQAESIATADALREEYYISQQLKQFKEVNSIISISEFINIICQIEFNKTIPYCSNTEITTAYNDLLYEKNTDKIMMMETDDKNEERDYNPYPKLSKGKKIDSIDIKNYYIQEQADKIHFSIKVYDLSHFEEKLVPPSSKMNVMEWYIDFKNLITPDERLKVDYKISAHLEPTNNIWEVGKGAGKNIKDLINKITNRELFGSYKKEAYLWVKQPGSDISFPIKLETGNVTFNTAENSIDIEVEKEELGRYGIAPEMYGAGLPARIGETKAGFRFYQNPILNLPWLRFSFNISFMKEYFEKIENRPILSSVSEKILNKFADFSWDDFDEIFGLMEQSGFTVDTITLKDMEKGWIVTDEAPDKGISDKTFFIKPFFMDELKKSAIVFLSSDYKINSGPSSTLILASINETVGPMQSGDISKMLVEAMEKYDSEQNYVSLEATGSGVISYEIDELTIQANMIIVPGIFIAICVILFVNFRKVSYVILPLVGLSVSIIWLIGTMVLLGIRFNTMAVALVPLLMGLGVDYSVHMFHNYRAELEKGENPGGAISNSIKDVGTAMFLAALTTVIAFLSFLTASIPPLRDFGILCAIGILYTFIVTITLQASVRYILDRRKKSASKIRDNLNGNVKTMRKASKVVYKRPGLILLIGCIVTFIMIGGAVNIQTGFDWEDFLPEDNPSMELWGDIFRDFPFSTQNQEFILIEGDVASVDTLEGISKTYLNLEDDEFIAKNPDGSIKVNSVLSLIQNAALKNSTLSSEFNLDENGIPRDNSDVKKLYDYLYDSNEYYMDARSVLHRNDGSYDATVIRAYIDFSSSEEIQATKIELIYEGLKEDKADYGDATATVTGPSSSSHSVTTGLTESQILSTALSIILAAIVLIITYRNPLLGLIAIIPVAISIVWILGSIYFIGYSLNVMTVMVTSLTIGVGIDYSIHATERFRLVADKTGDAEKAMFETIDHTGGALFIAAMSTIAGFGMLIFAPIPPEQQFGVIMCLTILYSLITSIFILPPIIMKWGKWRKKKKGYIISPKKPR